MSAYVWFPRYKLVYVMLVDGADREESFVEHFKDVDALLSRTSEIEAINDPADAISTYYITYTRPNVLTAWEAQSHWRRQSGRPLVRDTSARVLAYTKAFADEQRDLYNRICDKVIDFAVERGISEADIKPLLDAIHDQFTNKHKET